MSKEHTPEPVTPLLPVSIDVKAERDAFVSWWRTWCPDRDVPEAS